MIPCVSVMRMPSAACSTAAVKPARRMSPFPSATLYSLPHLPYRQAARNFRRGEPTGRLRIRGSAPKDGFGRTPVILKLWRKAHLSQIVLAFRCFFALLFGGSLSPELVKDLGLSP